MKNILSSMFLFGTIFSASTGLAGQKVQHMTHTPKAKKSSPDVRLEYKGETTLKAGPQAVSFVLRNAKSKAIGESTLQILHEKKLHVLVYDESLTHFFHVHPTEKNGLWTTEKIPFEFDGNYFFWAEGQLKNVDHEFTPFLKLKIAGGKPATQRAPSLAETLSATSGNTTVTMKIEGALSENKEVMPTLEFSRNDNSPLQLSPYLGALAHVVIVPILGDKLIHVHPMAGSQPNDLMMHTTFPSKGDYRVWVQFIDGGTLKVAALAVNVK